MEGYLVEKLVNDEIMYIITKIIICISIEQGQDGITQYVLFFLKRCFINPNSLDNKGSWRILKDFYCLVTMLRELGLMGDRECTIAILICRSKFVSRLKTKEKHTRHCPTACTCSLFAALAWAECATVPDTSVFSPSFMNHHIKGAILLDENKWKDGSEQ